MTKCEQIKERCADIGREFFALRGQKSTVPAGCVLAGIRYVTALAGMNNYPSRAVPCGLLCQNSNAIVKYGVRRA